MKKIFFFFLLAFMVNKVNAQRQPSPEERFWATIPVTPNPALVAPGHSWNGTAVVFEPLVGRDQNGALILTGVTSSIFVDRMTVYVKEGQRNGDVIIKPVSVRLKSYPASWESYEKRRYPILVSITISKAPDGGYWYWVDL